MHHILKACALAALACCAACPAGAQTSAAPSTSTQSVTVAGYKKASPWFRAESAHFIVYADTSREATAELLDNLERLDFLLRVYTKPFRKAGAAQGKLTLYYQDRVAGLDGIDAAMPADAIGLYSSCTAGVQGFGFDLGEASRNEGLSYIFEGYARHFLYRHTDIRAPAAFIDGFAQYFASVRFTDTQMRIGKAPPNIAHYLDFLEEGHRYSLDYADVLEDRTAKARNYAGEPGVRLEFAAKAWVLMHFMQSSEEQRARLNKYLAVVYQGAPSSAAFEEAFGLKVAALGTEMWRYRRTAAKILLVDVPELPKATVDFNALPEAAGQFVMLDAAVKSCPGRQAGEALLRKIGAEAAKVPKNDFAQMTLSRAQIAYGDPKLALLWLTEAVARNNTNFDAVYLSGLAKLRLAEQNPDDGAQQAAQQQLLDARSLDPESAEAAHAYYRVELLGRGALSETALEGALTAWLGARDVGTYARAAALTQAYLGNDKQAKVLLKNLALNPRDAASAGWARGWQAKLGAGASRDDIIAAMRADAAADGGIKAWTIDTKSVMDTVRYNAGLDAAQNYFYGQTVNPGSPDKAMMSTPVKR